jgi:8-oxo-dGTP pyrophosphatase MutT (NUDIX family)
MVNKWKTLKSKNILQNRIFSFNEEQVLSPKNKKFPVWVMEAPTWINIIPVTSDNRIIMVKQYRFGNKEITLEIPGGMSEPNEDPKSAAIREMKEETGYTSENVIEIGSVSPNPALMNNQAITYLAFDVELTSIQNLDTMEDIEIIEINLEEVPRLIQNKTINHALVVSAFYFFDKYKG